MKSTNRKLEHAVTCRFSVRNNLVKEFHRRLVQLRNDKIKGVSMMSNLKSLSLLEDILSNPTHLTAAITSVRFRGNEAAQDACS